MEPVNVFDYEKLAQARMAPPLWEYYQGGSDDEVTMRDCRAAFERIPKASAPQRKLRVERVR